MRVVLFGREGGEQDTDLSVSGGWTQQEAALDRIDNVTSLPKHFGYAAELAGYVWVRRASLPTAVRLLILQRATAAAMSDSISNL